MSIEDIGAALPEEKGRCALGKSGCEVRLDSVERVKNQVDDMAAALPKEKAKECLATWL